MNGIFRRVGLIAGDAAELTSLTDSARQVSVDVAVQVINEGIEELFTASEISMPNEQSSSTVTLLTGTRNYTLQTNLVTLHWPLIDRTNSQYINQYPGGYDQMLIDDPEQDDTGLPHYGVIRPTDGALFLDRAPTSADNGKIYTYQYEKNLALSAAADTVPFGDPVFRAMVPAWVQLWKRERRNEFDGDLFKASIGRASRLLPQVQARTSYSPR